MRCMTCLLSFEYKHTYIFSLLLEIIAFYVIKFPHIPMHLTWNNFIFIVSFHMNDTHFKMHAIYPSFAHLQFQSPISCLAIRLMLLWFEWHQNSISNAVLKSQNNCSTPSRIPVRMATNNKDLVSHNGTTAADNPTKHSNINLSPLQMQAI